MCEFCENKKKEILTIGTKTTDCGAFGIFQTDLDIDCVENRLIAGTFAKSGSCDFEVVETKINYCPLCGRKLSEENHSDPFRQMLKEVAEEMPAKGECDGKYAFRYGSFGYIEDGLHHIDFSCSNCGKRHEGVLFGNDVTCECGKIIRTGLDGKTEND